MEKQKKMVVDSTTVSTVTDADILLLDTGGGGDGFNDPKSSLKVCSGHSTLYSYLSPYEPLIMTIQSLLVWETPWKSCILFAFVHVLFWFVSTTSSRFFFLLSVFIMAAVFIDTWKNRIWKFPRELSQYQEDSYGWTPVHPRLLSVPELSIYLDGLGESVIETGNWLRKSRIRYPLAFCLGNTVFFTLTAMIGYYISGFMLIYVITLSLMLWPGISYNSLLKKTHVIIQPTYTRLGCYMKDKTYWLFTFGGRVSIPPFLTNAVSEILSRTASILSRRTSEPSEDEDFMPQGDHDSAFGKAIGDSEEDTSNSGIPTPRMSKAPSINNILDDDRNENDFQEHDFDLHLSQMPSFDDLDNTDDELELSSMTPHKTKNTELQFTPRHFDNEDSDFNLPHDYDASENQSTDAAQSAMLLGLATTALGGPQTGSLVAQTLSTMMESALQSAMGQGQSASSSSVIPRTGAKMTYTRSEGGESIDFQNSEPTIDEEDDDYEAASRTEQIAEIENSFDFLDEFDPNLPDNF